MFGAYFYGTMDGILSDPTDFLILDVTIDAVTMFDVTK